MGIVLGERQANILELTRNCVK